MHRSGCDGRCFLCIGFQSNILYKSLRYFHVIADVFCCFDRISKGWRSRSQSFHKLRVARFCLSLGKVFIPNFKYSLRQISSDRPVKMDPVLVQTCRYHLHEHNLRKLRNVSFWWECCGTVFSVDTFNLRLLILDLFFAGGFLVAAGLCALMDHSDPTKLRTSPPNWTLHMLIKTVVIFLMRLSELHPRILLTIDAIVRNMWLESYEWLQTSTCTFLCLCSLVSK